MLDKNEGFCLNDSPPGKTPARVGMPPSHDPLYSGLGQAVRVSTDLLSALIVGGALGWGLDTYILPTKPWGLVVGLILGLIAGVRNAYRTAQRWKTSD